MDTIVNYAVLSDTHTIKTKEDKAIVSSLYAKTNWQASTLSAPLSELLLKEKLIVIKTDNITVIDFDDNDVFEQALRFNASLAEPLQCGLIIRSTRHGGHFYYLPDDSIELPLGHTKQSVLDILTTIKHNVLAPTPNEQGKVIEHQGIALTKYNVAINTFVSLLVIQNIPQASRAMALHDGERRSDDAQDFIKGYLANIVSQTAFDQFYNIPSPIPEGQSNTIYLSLSTRLGSDETISIEDYKQAMIKFNIAHQRKTPEALIAEIINRMVPSGADKAGPSINGLWRYDAEKVTNTFTTTHRRYKTQISTYFNSADGSYLIHFLDAEGTARLHIVSHTGAYTELLEKISNVSKAGLRNKTTQVAVVDVINDYTTKAGYDHQLSTYNKAFINSNLTAFGGTRPLNYEEPKKLLELLEYMWGEEYEYLLTTTKYRYSTFQYSPVVTFLQGTEGSGKDLTIYILTAGFSNPPQNLNYQLLKDKHSNWQIEENAVFSEVGSWKPMERDDLLAELKTISGSNGRVTFRDMQKTAQVVPTLIKIWVTGNEWLKMHTDPITQRRVHIVYMPKPLGHESGGPYSSGEIQQLLSEDSIINFYYWLGNEYQEACTADKYMSAISRQGSEAYKMYLEDVESSSDRVSALLWSRNYGSLTQALELYNITINDLVFKYGKTNDLQITVASLKTAFSRGNGDDVISKTINRLSAEKEGNKRLNFGRGSVEKFLTIFDAPNNLEKMEEIKDVS